MNKLFSNAFILTIELKSNLKNDIQKVHKTMHQVEKKEKAYIIGVEIVSNLSSRLDDYRFACHERTLTFIARRLSRKMQKNERC